MLLIDFWLRRPFHSLLNPATALWISDVGELYAARSRIDAPGFMCKFVVNLQLWMRLRLQESERINICFQVSPAPERIEYTFAFRIRRAAYIAHSFARGSSQSGHTFS